MKDCNKLLRGAIAVLGVVATFAGCAQTKRGVKVSAPCPIRIIETRQGFLIIEGGEKILFYQREPKSLVGKYSRANYIHPLYGLDGEILTEDFPTDHRHHRGVFWAWHQVYVGDKKMGDAWSIEDFSWDVVNARILEVDAQSRALKVEVLWKSPRWTDAEGEQKPFVKETTSIRVYRAEGDIRKIDFEISLLALADGVRIGGAENEKAYGGFSTRIRLPDGMRFTGQSGAVEVKGTPIEAGPWLDFSGPLGRDGRVSGLAILCHKSSPGYPQRWILRRKTSMQNPVYPGRDPIPLSRERPLVLRYRLITHRGDAQHVNLNKLQAEYNAEGPYIATTDFDDG